MDALAHLVLHRYGCAYYYIVAIADTIYII